MENLPQWILDSGIEIEFEEKEVQVVNAEIEASVEKMKLEVEADKKWQAEKRKGLIHKPFKALKAA